MYKIEKLTVKNRCEIPVGSVVEIEVNEEVSIETPFLHPREFDHR